MEKVEAEVTRSSYGNKRVSIKRSRIPESFSMTKCANCRKEGEKEDMRKINCFTYQYPLPAYIYQIYEGFTQKGWMVYDSLYVCKGNYLDECKKRCAEKGWHMEYPPGKDFGMSDCEDDGWIDSCVAEKKVTAALVLLNFGRRLYFGTILE